MNNQQRYDYIDTLKGGAIIFVVLYHSQFLSLIYEPNSVRPLIFMIISGMFFRESVSWLDFFRKSIRGLIVPYIAYNILCGIEYNLLHACGVNMPVQDITATFYASLPHLLPNTPTWFLITLFLTSLIFRCVYKISNTLSKRWRNIIIVVTCITIGYVGYYIGYRDIHTPLFPEVALTGIVFYAMGYMWAKKPGIKYNKRLDLIGYILIVPALIAYVVLRGRVSMAENDYTIPYLQLLLMMTSLYAGIFYLCKLIGKVPIVTYLGRYSLIVLCTHMMILPLLMGVSLRFFNHDTAVVITGIVALLLLRWAVVPFCKKYLPWISGEGFKK